MKKLVQKILFRCSRAILRKYKPKVIGITGSIGKTSAKEAIFAVVSAKFKARKNIKNYNNEFGLPFTIIGVDSPKRNVLKWLGLFAKAFWMIYFYSEYPKVLVLELGIDRPGDMDVLMDIVKPDIAVLTTIGISHLQYFSSEQQILEEKSKIFRDLGARDTAILNIDDVRVRQVISRLKTKIITYGSDHMADLRVVNYQTIYSQSSGTYGTSMQVKYDNKNASIFLGNTLGLPHVSAAACGAAVGLAMGMELSEISTALMNYAPEPGRLRAIRGLQGSMIIDDTYNAAPLSASVAIDELIHFPAAKKIVVVGDMLELGNLSEQSHKDLAKKLAATAIDQFVAVGPQMKYAYEEMKRLSFKHDNLFWFEKSTDAIDKVKELLAPNTVVLVKGSQGVRMEKIVRAIMAEPAQAHRLLTRQEPDWLAK